MVYIIKKLHFSLRIVYVESLVDSPQRRPILGIGALNQEAPTQNTRSFQAVQELNCQLRDVDIKKGNHPTPPANLHLRTCKSYNKMTRNDLKFT